MSRTINYKEKYEKALERARVYWENDNDNTPDIKAKGTMEYLFPELAESEDERIRKALIDYFNNANKADENPLQSYSIHTDKVIAWLEKIKR